MDGASVLEARRLKTMTGNRSPNTIWLAPSFCSCVIQCLVLESQPRPAMKRIGASVCSACIKIPPFYL